jgi:hypothetical protein
MRKLFTILLETVYTLIIITSCDKEADNGRFPGFTQKLVISGYLSPGKSNQYISVGSNLRLYGDLWGKETWGNLNATLSNGSTEISLDTTRTGFVFSSSDFPVEEGKTYTLKVGSDFGLSAGAYCTVPFKRRFDLEIDTARIISTDPDPYQPLLHIVNVYFTDIQGEKNYYRLICELITYNLKTFKAPFILRLSGPEIDYFTDKGRDGMRSKFELNVVGVNQKADSAFLKVYLLNTDKSYYDYHRSLGNYDSGDDPFTEPSPVFSNVNGGLGIFAAYTVDSLIFRLK